MTDKYKEIKNVVISREGESKLRFAKVEHTGFLEKVENGAALRTDLIKGRCSTPVIGEPFLFITKPLDSSLSSKTDCRSISTSLVLAIENLSDNVIQFKTENSIYKLTLFHLTQ